MRLRDLGELGLIERIARMAARAGPRPRHWGLGLGDDAALLRPPPGHEIVVTTDALVERVHFRWATESPSRLGRRALAATLSDLAAMGAEPLGVLLALEAPPSLELSRLDALLRGLLAAARSYSCPLVGGNVTRHSRTALTLTALGKVARGRALTRSAARPGDRLYVTGTLGRTALEVVRAGREGRPVRHVPVARLRAGRALALLSGVGACIDISDGLLADLDHLLRASHVGVELSPDRVPLPRGFGAACRRLGLRPERLALEGGEDYELLFTVRPSGLPAHTLRRRLGLRVSEIGHIVGRGRPGARGWRHF